MCRRRTKKLRSEMPLRGLRRLRYRDHRKFPIQNAPPDLLYGLVAKLSRSAGQNFHKLFAMAMCPPERARFATDFPHFARTPERYSLVPLEAGSIPTADHTQVKSAELCPSGPARKQRTIGNRTLPASRLHSKELGRLPRRQTAPRLQEYS